MYLHFVHQNNLYWIIADQIIYFIDLKRYIYRLKIILIKKFDTSCLLKSKIKVITINYF